MKRYSKQRLKNSYSIFAIALFFLLLWLPVVQSVLKIFPEKQNTEKRQLTSKPFLEEYSIKGVIQYFSSFEEYFNDNFGFRNTLLQENSKIKINLFGISPLKKVIIGKSGWLFYDDPSDGKNLLDYAGKTPFNNSELKKISENNQKRVEWFSDHNIVFLIVIPPNKHSVYPEYLPNNKSSKGGDRLDQIMANEINKSVILDLEQSLVEAKKNCTNYYKTDTHWNKCGAYVGYKEAMQRLYPKENIVQSESRFRTIDSKKTGDLAQMIAAESLLSDSEVVAPELEYTEKNQKIMVFHDSFGTLLNPYIEKTFVSAKFITRPTIDYNLIENEKPDIVIWEMVERYSANLLAD